MTNYHKNIAIFAGGLGTRLKGTEALPKPLVDINGKRLIERVIHKIIDTNEFDRIMIVKCEDEYNHIYEEILEVYKDKIRIKIHQEKRRSGRAGAVKYVFDNEPNIEELYFCNGDTIIKDLGNLKYYSRNNIERISPVIYLANTDTTRKDYKEIEIIDKSGINKYQNSGYFSISKEWFRKAIRDIKELDKTDIDDLLFDNKNENIYQKLGSTLYDAGTPSRLRLVRKIFR